MLRRTSSLFVFPSLIDLADLAMIKSCTDDFRYPMQMSLWDSQRTYQSGSSSKDMFAVKSSYFSRPLSEEWHQC